MVARLAAIVAMDEARVIGDRGALPWHIPEDMAHFRTLTKGSPVIMGRKTWDSLPEKFRPLPGRKNIVVSRSERPQEIPVEVAWIADPEGAVACAMEHLNSQGTLATDGAPQRVWVIGGVQLYKELLPRCSEVFLTKVKGVHEGDAYLPEFEGEFALTSVREGAECSFLHYVRI